MHEVKQTGPHKVGALLKAKIATSFNSSFGIISAAIIMKTQNSCYKKFVALSREPQNHVL